MKKIITLVLAVVLTASAVIGGTIAYLSSTDSDVNVMTVGNVKIEQHEFERVPDGNGGYELITSGRGEGYKLQPFTQDKPLFPVYGTVTGWNESTYVWFDQLGSTANGGQKILDGIVGAQDKFVLVKNTGKSDAFVRTLIAFELGTLSAERWDEIIMTSYADFWKTNDIGEMEIEGNNYFVVEYVYQGSDVRHQDGVLAAGDYSYNSLAQIYMKSSATNDDVLALDGNGNEKYDIIVKSQACQTANLDSFDPSVMRGAANKTVAEIALDIAFGESEEVAGEALGGVWLDYITPDVDLWDGTADTSWYNDTDTEFTLSTAEQLAGLADLVDGGNTFEGKTIALESDVDLYLEDENGEPKCFEPIGSYRKDTAFKGEFDGNGHTISNMSQNTWALDNGYAYGDLGLGFFGLVEDAAIKNVVFDGASISGESAICGTVAGCAYGDCTFENITVKNSNVADYQYYSGGIVGWASGNHQYINCNIEESTNIAAQWGDFDNSIGGVIGGAGGSAQILLKDCTVACRIDAYNDVTSSYQWYAYRRAGMLIGNSGITEKVGDTTYATAPQLTCENVTVIYGEWANYTYCEFAGKSWPYVRVQAGVSNSAYSNPRYGHPTDANGKEVVDDNHVHNEGEDHFILCAFDQLYGGGQGVYGGATHDGVTIIYNNK